MSNGVHCADHSGCITKIEHIEKQTHLNTTDIKTVGDAVIRLTAILEMMQKAPQPAPQPQPPKLLLWMPKPRSFLIKWGFCTYHSPHHCVDRN